MKFERRETAWLARTAATLQLDLVLLVAATLAADLAVVGLERSPLRTVGGLFLLFFLPGYAVVAALFPATDGPRLDNRRGLTGYERVALAFGVSIALAPLVGLGLWLAGAWLALPWLLGALTGVVLVGAGVAAARRLLLPPSRRYHLPLGRWYGAAMAGFGRSTPAVDRALNAFLALAVLLAGGALGYALVVPTSGEAFTTASLLTENPDGELVASGYPSDFEAGSGQPLVLALENHEGEATGYTVVVRIESVETVGDDLAVREATELDRLSARVGAGERALLRHEVAPSMTGDRLRLSYYVYKGEAPANPDADGAYRHLYLWVSVRG